LIFWFFEFGFYCADLDFLTLLTGVVSVLLSVSWGAISPIGCLPSQGGVLSFCASAGAPFASVTLSGVVGSALLRVLLVGCSCTVSVTV